MTRKRLVLSNVYKKKREKIQNFHTLNSPPFFLPFFLSFFLSLMKHPTFISHLPNKHVEELFFTKKKKKKKKRRMCTKRRREREDTKDDEIVLAR